ncbi:MAG: hypothetical protein KKE30_11180 [Gammaproteobacteria bacterium]|nr:hypothetical protein [Gammaproteobacteria bacterium]MBU1553966.1 hypothetical protein [Gammaproteobacteria bacterium]MBU2069529.1 hypothetical protein [Gammaproteobacteria bacterium]MBU2183075.1 hypothetical protein [Gammaproteobacteria bacterium]MBU2203097.1 hypothetical protein [Gammaproteobacteria bacterium]
MSQIIEELYFEKLPVDLFRHGTTTSPQMHKPRTMPPRELGEVHDLKIYKKGGIDWVDHESGGISLFNKPNLRFGNRWWKLPKGAQIPSGMRVSRDKGMNPVTGQIHYTIRPLHDMPLSSFIQKLKDFSAVAMPDFPLAQRKV